MLVTGHKGWSTFLSVMLINNSAAKYNFNFLYLNTKAEFNGGVLSSLFIETIFRYHIFPASITYNSRNGNLVSLNVTRANQNDRGYY